MNVEKAKELVVDFARIQIRDYSILKISRGPVERVREISWCPVYQGNLMDKPQRQSES